MSAFSTMQAGVVQNWKIAHAAAMQALQCLMPCPLLTHTSSHALHVINNCVVKP